MSVNKQFELHSRPVIFGEVLFDHFPDGSKHLGGAPFNVAWHLQGFCLRPLFVTRIGQDTEGELILTEMVRWGMDTQAVQIDPGKPTGYVTVTEQDGQPQYEIPAGQAWDNISRVFVAELIKDMHCSFIYFGSLAQRDSTSRNTLQRLLSISGLQTFVDINLRSPWFSDALLHETLDKTTWLKVNEEELHTLTGSSINTQEARAQAAKTLCQHHGIEAIYITRGENGAEYVSLTGEYATDAPSLTGQANPVGAGDAFTAVCIYGQHKGWDNAKILLRATAFAAKVCEGQGALPIKQSDYDVLLNA